MRKVVFSLVVTVLTAIECMAQSLAPKTSFSIDAKEVASRKSIKHQWETEYGSYDRDFARTRVLSIDVKNLSKLQAGDCKVRVYWIARNLATKQPFIHDAGSIDTKPGAVQNYTHECKELPANVQNYAALGERYVKGAKLDGWVVLLTRDDEVLAMKASSEAYARVFRDPQQRDTLLNTTPENNVMYRAQFRWN